MKRAVTSKPILSDAVACKRCIDAQHVCKRLRRQAGKVFADTLFADLIKDVLEGCAECDGDV